MANPTKPTIITSWSKEVMEETIRRYSTDERSVRDIMEAVMGCADLLCTKDSKGRPEYTARFTVSETEKVAQSHTGERQLKRVRPVQHGSQGKSAPGLGNPIFSKSF